MLSLSRRLSLSFVAVVVLATALFSAPAPAAAAPAPSFVSIHGNKVNVREKPNTRSATLWELGSGYPLQVRQRKGNWLQVRDFESTLGWVHAPLTSKKAHLIVTAPQANLRNGPGTSYKKIGQLEQHEVVRTLKKSGRWAHVQREGGQKGWIARSLAWGW